MRVGLLLIMAVLLGCSQPRPELSRFDGKDLEPVAREQSMAECRAKAQVATTQVPHKFLGDNYGIVRGVDQQVASRATFEGCMAEKGVRVTWVDDNSVQTGSVGPK